MAEENNAQTYDTQESSWWDRMFGQNTTDDVTVDEIIDYDTGAKLNIDGSIKPITKVDTSGYKPTTKDTSSMWSGKNIGSTMQGIGSIGGAIASVYGISEQSRFNKDMLQMEKDRVAKNEATRDKKQAEYDAVWKTS